MSPLRGINHTEGWSGSDGISVGPGRSLTHLEIPLLSSPRAVTPLLAAPGGRGRHWSPHRLKVTQGCGGGGPHPRPGSPGPPQASPRQASCFLGIGFGQQKGSSWHRQGGQRISGGYRFLEGLAQEAVCGGTARQGEVMWLEAPHQFPGCISRLPHPCQAGRCPGPSKMGRKIRPWEGQAQRNQ